MYQELEKAYAEFDGHSHAVSVNTGTAALHLALAALGVGPGDEVIVPDFTMAACGFAVAYTGAKPVFVDCKDDLTIDPELIEAKITEKTKVIMPVHIYGRLCDMPKIMQIARRHSLFVVEDACEAQGAVFSSPADITCYSFYKNKIIAAEEGGICTTDDELLADRMRYLKNMAFSEAHDYYHADIGFNYRMSDSQAKLALESLNNFHLNYAKRREVEAWYDEFLAEKSMGQRDTVWVYDVKIHFIPLQGTRHFFQPLSSFPMWKQAVGKKARYYSQFMYLPVNPNISYEEVKDLCLKLK